MISRHYHLAQVNVARMIAPLDSPLMADFVEQIPAVNAMADASPGFVWRLATAEGDATAVRAYGDARILFNLSLWESPEGLKEFTYRSGHSGPFRDRARWFEPPAQPHMALWWVPAGHLPSVEEAVDRLEFRRVHGDTAAAFGLAKPAAMPEEPRAEAAPFDLNLDGRLFVSAENTSNGDAGPRTRFLYRQSGERVWATYDGGGVRFGALVAVSTREGTLDMRYQHVNGAAAVRTGMGVSRAELLPDGRVRLIEEWQWTNGDRSRGRSVIEEAGTG
jgi:hypothetical protein